MKLISKIIAYTTAITLIVLVLFFGWLKSISPGTTNPITDENGDTLSGSVAEVIRPEIGGIDQLLIIRGKNNNNPVLLMLHGGPGSPQAPLTCYYNKQLEDHYIVVNWDQRGAGGSYDDQMPLDSLNINRMIEDTREVSQYLINRFQKEKIFILGHSWGSYLGLRTVHQYPELFHAYIGIGQVSNQPKSEELSYLYVMEKAKEENNKKAIKQLEKIGYPENGLYNDMEKAMKVERNWVMEYGGAAWGRDKIDFGKLFIKPLIFFREYTVTDKINFIKGMNVSLEKLWEPLMTQHLTDIVTKVEVPVYILQGTHDQQTSYILAKEYFEKLEAPEKHFIEFENSAHLVPYNNEIDKFHKVMNEQIPNEMQVNE
ncbi:MAG: alpha/beta hydrolase [Prolixibacteraceae bacterium]|nr:alpha/beta hydrolase [Prolixibacteraceae bacterium]